MKSYQDISQALFERTEAYLSGKLTPSERADFEEEMARDETLRAEVALQRELMQAVELGGMEEMLQEIEKEWHSNSDVNAAQPRRYWFAMAASILALVSLGVWMLFNPAENRELFAHYVVSDPGLPVPMSSTENYQFYDAMVDFKNEKYQLAFEKWSELQAGNPKSDTLNYYLGAAMFQQERYDAAIPYFSSVYDQKSPAFSAKSQFYLVLSWLQTGEYEKIEAISAEALPPYQSEIREIEQALMDAQ